ncbi:MAG: exosortase-associated EpsI family protein [Dehalococcoidia bacterium]
MSWRNYLPVIGVFLLAIVLVFLLSDSQVLLSKGISLVSTELGKKSEEETLVWAKSGFKDNQEILNFPAKIGKWEGQNVSQQEMTSLRERLDANVFLMRTYYKQGFSTPVFFLIIQAKESSAFHRPPVCYKALGYIVEEDKNTVQVDPSHLGTDKAPDAYVGGTVPMKKLWLTKRKEGEVTERRIALYCYLKGNQFTGDTINMVRFSTLAPVDGSPDNVLQEMKEFTGLAMPHLFEIEEHKSKMLFHQLVDRGLRGWGILIGGLAFPIALTTYPLWRRRK